MHCEFYDVTSFKFHPSDKNVYLSRVNKHILMISACMKYWCPKYNGKDVWQILVQTIPSNLLIRLRDLFSNIHTHQKVLMNDTLQNWNWEVMSNNLNL